MAASVRRDDLPAGADCQRARSLALRDHQSRRQRKGKRDQTSLRRRLIVRPCWPRDGDAQDVRLLLRVGVLAFLLVMLCAIAAAQAASTSASEILANPDRFDGQTVTISGTI